ncbi:glycoside hydrolase family 25 protein [Schizophyllum fasciatum]
MLCLTALLLALASLALSAPAEKRAQPQGIDVSGYQGTVDWAKAKANGVTFAYIKATEGTTFKSSSFSSQYTGATSAGIIRGAYHFARPDTSGGAAQAKYFVANGGAWSGELAQDITTADNPYGSTCYGLSASAMVAWIQDFSDTYHSSTGRYPGTQLIYTSTSWWTTCTGNSAAFAKNNPLWVARYASAVGALPAGWTYHTFWQYADSGRNPGDQDVFNGDAAGLKRLASG